MKGLLIAVLVFVMPGLSCAEDEQAGFLADFVVGEYHMIGKMLDSEQAFSGDMKIFAARDRLVFRRSVADQVVHGCAAIEMAGDGEHVLRLRFKEAGERFEETCLVDSDLDNYARLTCYLYKPGVATERPGLEAMFIRNPGD